MNSRKFFAVAAVIMLASTAACLSETESPMLPDTITTGALLVDTGFTSGNFDPVWGGIGEFSAFTLRWTPVADAQYYEVRVSETPLTVENWEEATLADIITAPADTADVFVKVEVQEEPCIGCGLCEEVCPMDAITVQGGVAVIDYDLCTSCGQCQDVCPVEAITGARYAVDYYFGIRAFFNENSPAQSVAATDEAYKLIYYNYDRDIYGITDPYIPSCGHCEPTNDSLGCHEGCYILNVWADNEQTVFTGPGCPVDAFWQDTTEGPEHHMLYIDYDDCINCGQCFLECWNYEATINPDPNAYNGLKSVRKRVVPASWVPSGPERP